MAENCSRSPWSSSCATSSAFPGGPIQPISLWTWSPWPSSCATSSSFQEGGVLNSRPDSMAGYHVGFGTQAPIATHCSGPKLGHGHGQPWSSSFEGASEEFFTRQGEVWGRRRRGKTGKREREGKETTPEGSKFLTFSPPFVSNNNELESESESCPHNNTIHACTRFGVFGMLGACIWVR